MAHAFSVEIHDFLSKKILLAEEGKERALLEGDAGICKYYEGQLLELIMLRRHLTEHIDLKTQKYY